VDFMVEHFMSAVLWHSSSHNPLSYIGPSWLPVPRWTNDRGDAIRARERALQHIEIHPKQENIDAFKRLPLLGSALYTRG
jgi:hypothetical protein